MDREAWWATVHGVTKSRTRLKQLSIAYHGMAWHGIHTPTGRLREPCPVLSLIIQFPFGTLRLERIAYHCDWPAIARFHIDHLGEDSRCGGWEET